MSNSALLGAVVEAVGRLLNESVTLHDDLSFSDRAVVARLRRHDGSTVVAKRPADETSLRRELAVYDGIPAEFRGDLIAHGDHVLVIEDLGDGPSLADLLLGADPDAATAGLLTWARGIGRMAAATLGKPPPTDEFFPRRTDIDFTRTLSVVEEMGLVPRPVEHELRAVTALLDPPVKFTALTPGDICPDNNRISADSVQLFDFEFASWHHVALDVSFCRLPFSTCWCVAALPGDIGARMEAALVGELGITDEDELSAAVTLAGAWFVLPTIASLREVVDQNVRHARHPMTGRERAGSGSRGSLGRATRCPHAQLSRDAA